MSKTFPRRDLIERFGVLDNCLCVGRRNISDLAKEAGGTPFYVYDKQLISNRVAELRDVLGNTVALHYAIKANPMPELVNHVSQMVDGLDVASLGELNVALESGMAAELISFAGPGKSVAELTKAVKSGVTINVESETELDRISEISNQHGVRASIAIRVNPDFELKSSGMKMSGGPKQFGIDAELVPSILGSLKKRSVEFVGFHIFSGSQNLSADAIVDAQQKSLDLALELAVQCDVIPKKLNIGGGFGIPYFPGDDPLDLSLIKSNLRTLSAKLASSYNDARLIIELGRFIVGEAGLYVTTVTDRKVSRGRTYLICDGGLHHHLALSGNFGQVIRRNYPVVAATNVHSLEKELVWIVGPLCTPLDTLGDNVELPRTEIGDMIAVFQSGAYGLTASPTRFLSHMEPTELLV